MPSPAPDPVAVEAPLRVPERPVPIDPLAEPWLVGSALLPITHRLEVAAALRAAATPEGLAAAPVDSVITTLAVRWDGAGESPRLTGAIVSFGVRDGARAAVVPRGLALPVAIRAAVDHEGGVVRLDAPRDSGCGPDVAAAALVRELLVAPPRQLVRGMTWADSVRTSICRDSIPITLASVRRFVVEGAGLREGRVVVVIRRTSTMTLRGSGTQFGEPITLSGTGEGALLFGLRLDDGQLLEGEGFSGVHLTLVGRHKTQVVTQNARLEIRRAF